MVKNQVNTQERLLCRDQSRRSTDDGGISATHLHSRHRALQLGGNAMKDLETEEDAKDEQRGKVPSRPGGDRLLKGALGARALI